MPSIWSRRIENRVSESTDQGNRRVDVRTQKRNSGNSYNIYSDMTAITEYNKGVKGFMRIVYCVSRDFSHWEKAKDWSPYRDKEKTSTMIIIHDDGFRSIRTGLDWTSGRNSLMNQS